VPPQKQRLKQLWPNNPGAGADYEGVVLIPFIDQDRLLAAARSVPPAALAPEERARNTPGDILVFTHAEGSREESFCASTMPAAYGSVTRSNSRALAQPAPPPLPAGERGFVPRFVPGTKVGAGAPAGFPTLRTLGVSGELRRAGVNVFGMTSKKESLMLAVREPAGAAAELAAPQVAAAVAGQRAWVKWPYLQECLVEAVSDATQRAGREGPPQRHSAAEADDWWRQCGALAGELALKQGVEVGEVRLLLHVRPCDGLVRQLDGTVEKRFSKKEAAYPLQLTLRRNPAPDPRFEPEAAGAALAGATLAPGARAIFLGRAHYGCVATVLPDAAGAGLGPRGEAAAGRRPHYRVEVAPSPAATAQAAAAARRILGNVGVAYQPSGQVARRLGVSSRTLGRITGNVWVQVGEERRDRVDVGLCVKHGGKNLYVPDFVAPAEDRPRRDDHGGGGRGGGGGGGGGGRGGGGGAEGEVFKGGWVYSDALVKVLEQYKQRYTFVWVALEQNPESFDFDLEALLPGVDPAAAKQHLGGLRAWLEAQPLFRRPLVKFTAKVAPEPAVRMLQSALPPPQRPLPPAELDNVAPPLLLPPLEPGGMEASFAGGSFDLADRVVSVGAGAGPPFGARGTVVGLYDEAVEVLFDAPFAGGTDLFGRCAGAHGALLPATHLLNLSKPHAVKAEGAAAPRMVRRTGAAPPAPAEPAAAPAAAANGRAAPAAAPAPSPAAALAAATAGLQRPKGVANGGGAARPPVAAAPKPKIPDAAGSKGFAAAAAGGRGRGTPPPFDPPPPAAPAPASPGAGGALLAQLQRSPAAAPGAAPPPPPPHAMMMMPPPNMAPPPGLMLPHHPHMMMMPPPPPGMAPPFIMPPPHPLPGGAPWPPPHPLAYLPPGMAPPHVYAPPPPPQAQPPASPPAQPMSPPGGDSGSALLAQLLRQPPSPPAPKAAGDAGAQLLNKLQTQQPAAPQPQSSPQPGNLLLQRLQTPAPASPAAPAPPAPVEAAQPPVSPPPPEAVGGDLSAMWERMQLSHAVPAPGEAASGPPPPPPSAAFLGGPAAGGEEAVPPKKKAPRKKKAAAAAAAAPASLEPEAAPAGPPPSADDLWAAMMSGN
jgi:5'-3' exoribonuclease 1